MHYDIQDTLLLKFRTKTPQTSQFLCTFHTQQTNKLFYAHQNIFLVFPSNIQVYKRGNCVHDEGKKSCAIPVAAAGTMAYVGVVVNLCPALCIRCSRHTVSSVFTRGSWSCGMCSKTDTTGNFALVCYTTSSDIFFTISFSAAMFML